MVNQTLPILITFLVYIVIILFIGYLASRITKNLSDYMLAGRRLSGPIAALGAGASDMSGWLLMALPGAVYLNGINQIWLPMGLTIGAYFNWQFVAKRLRIYTEVANDSITIPSYFDNRFQDSKKILRATTALVVVIFFTFYSASGFVAGAVLAQSTFGLDYTHALLISGGIIVIYTCIGGFFAVSWIDFFQGTLMFLALLIVPIATIKHLGGWQQSINNIALQHMNYINAFSNISVMTIISLLAWGLGYPGQPHILVRFMATKSSHEIPIARLICMFWMVASLYGAIFTGFIGIEYYKNNPLANHEAVFLELSKALFNPWITGILLAAVLSAIMSTIAAQLLASSSALVEDFYHGFFHKKGSAKEFLWVSRMAVLIISAIAMALALNPKSDILDLVSHAWAGLGASFGPVIIFSLFWVRTTRNGALAGMVTGAFTALAWHLLQNHVGGIFNLYEMVPAFLLNCIAILIVSLLDNPPSPEILKQFEEMKRRL